MSETIPHVTEKNTKRDIMYAYNIALKEVKLSKEGKTNPRAASKISETRKVVATASKQTVADVVNGLATVRLEANSAISDLEEKLVAKKNQLDNIQKAIDAEEISLEEVYGIQREADSLASLLQAQDLKMEAFNKGWTDQASRHNDLQKALAQDRKRDEEEYQYTQKN